MVELTLRDGCSGSSRFHYALGGVRPLDAATLREVMSRFVEALRLHRDELNSLNVYPVPDGDTGTNMLLTQEAVVAELSGLGGAGLRGLGEAIARASLLGARGNSGVILSQVLRGLCERLCATDDPGPRDLAEALARASDEAYRAVARPVEGTALSVMADAARAAATALDGACDCGAVADAALAAARTSLDRTREMLPELRAAGVVDAGGKGMVLLLDALSSVLGGRAMTEEVGPPGPVGRAERPPDREGPRFRYEVQYLLETRDEEVGSLTERLAHLGDSVVVVGGRGLFKVHVHTNEPGAAVEEGVGAGRPRQITVADLEGDVAGRCLTGQARAVRVAGQRVAVVAVVEGEGLARILRSLGAVVVRGGPGRNPSVGELVEAIEAAPAGTVVVLPNHPNVVPAATLATRDSGKDARVLATRSVPQGVAAAAAFNPTEGPEENLEAMRRAAEACGEGALTRAVRDADTPSGPVREGAWLGLSGDRVVEVADDAAAVAVALVRRLRRPDHQIVTLFVGAAPSEEEAGGLERALREAFPDLEFEVHRGGQPRHPYLIGLE